MRRSRSSKGVVRGTAAPWRRAFSGLVVACCSAISASCAAQTQTFQNPPLLTTALDPAGIIGGDWNGDGHQDLIYVDRSPTPALHVLLGNGKGAFSALASVQLPAGTCSVYFAICQLTAGHFTASGHQDLLMSWSNLTDDGFLVLPGNGDGTFGAPVLSTFPSTVGAPLANYGAVAEYGNGNLDLAVPDNSESPGIDLYFGDGAGRFTTAGKLSGGGELTGVFAADVNNDDNIDLVSYDLGGPVLVWLGNGKGDFTQAPASSTGTSACIPTTLADLNGDSNIDILCNDRAGNIDVMTGNGNGTFAAPQVLVSGLNPADEVVAATDLNGDGIPDLIVSDTAGFNTILSKGKLSYGAVQTRTAGGSSWDTPFTPLTVVADFNEDGVPDIAAGVSGGIQFFFGNAQGNYSDSTIHATNSPVFAVFAGDFNGDSKADVVAIDSSGNANTYLGSSTGVSATPIVTSGAFASGTQWFGNAVGDFDGDGKLDAIETAPGAMAVLYGNGDGTFTPVTAKLPNTAIGGLIADLGNNGRSDVVGTTSANLDGEILYSELVALMGNSNRTFTQVITNLPPPPPDAANPFAPTLLALGDVNGDGFPDAVLYDSNVSALDIWFGKGDGTFTAGPITNIGGLGLSVYGLSEATPMSSSAVADMDGDGNPDLVFLASVQASSNTTNTVLGIAYGNGTGAFSQPQIVPLTHPYTTVALAKFGSSPYPAIVLGDGAVIGYIRNLGGRQFSQEEFYTAGEFNVPIAADFKGDGYADLLLAHPGAGAVPAPSPEFTVLLNQPDVTAPGSGEVTGTLTLSPSTISYNQPFTITATVQSSVTGGPGPTGTVSFDVAGFSLGSAFLVNGTATLPIPGSLTQTFPNGYELVEAQYSGDSNYVSSNLSAGLTVLQPVYSTQTALALTAGGQASAQAGAFVDMKATITSAVTVPAGYVAFYDGTTLLGQAEVSKGQALFGTNLLGVGPHSITAQYLGYVSPDNPMLGSTIDASFTSSTSAAEPITITAIATNTALATSGTTITAGTVLTLTATLSSSNGVPVGGVTFFDGISSLGSLTLDSGGSAALSTVSLTTGKHSLTAQYPANGSYASSNSPAISITVNAAPATLEVVTARIAAVTPSPTQGQSEVEIQVSSPAHTGLVPSGPVSLIADGVLVTTASLPPGGQLSLPVTLSGSGLHAVYAGFGGSAQAMPAASPVLTTTAYGMQPDFILQPGPDSALLTSVPLTIAAVNGWNHSVSLQCSSGVPSGYTCSFSSSTITGSGQTVLRLQPSIGVGTPAALLLPGLFIMGIRRRRRVTLALILTGIVLALSSCGGSALPRASGASIITVQGTSRSLVHSSQIIINVPAAQ